MKKIAPLLLAGLLAALPVRATSFVVTNDLGGPLNLSLYSVNANGTYNLGGLQGVGTNATATLTGTGTNWPGVLVLNTNSHLATVAAFSAFATNSGYVSYILSIGQHKLIQLASILATNAPGSNTNTSNPLPLNLSVLVGTNNPNGVITAGYGSVYNQFDGTGTNFVQQWIKQNATGNTNWTTVTTGGGSAGAVTNLASPTFQMTTLTNTATGHAVAFSQAAGVLGQGLTVAGEVKATGGFETPGGGFQADASGNVTALTLSGNGTGISNAPVSTTISNNILASAAAAAATIISTSAIPSFNLTGTVTNNTIHPLGGTNDDTFAFNYWMNQGGQGFPIFLPPGDFNVTNINITNDNATIYGYGCKLHMATNVTGYVICTRNMTNLTIAGLAVYGGIHMIPGWTFTSGITGPTLADWQWTSPGGGNGTPTNARSGFYLNGYGWNHWRDLTADGFNVAGFYTANTNTAGSYMFPLSSIDNCQANWCYVGFEIPGGLDTMSFSTNNAYLYYDSGGVIPYYGSPEYTYLNSPKAQNCTWGVSFGSPNFSMANPQIANCYIGVGALSRWHGQVNGGSINHCSWAWYGQGSYDGGTVCGTTMLGGNG